MTEMEYSKCQNLDCDIMTKAKVCKSCKARNRGRWIDKPYKKYSGEQLRRRLIVWLKPQCGVRTVAVRK